MIKAIDRLLQFIQYTGISARQFDLSIGAGNGYTLRMKKNNASIGSDVIATIVKTYPQLNVAWLITGEGNMLRTEKEIRIPNFSELAIEEQNDIERIIENKIKSRQELELRHLIKEVTSEIEKLQKKKEEIVKRPGAKKKI